MVDTALEDVEKGGVLNQETILKMKEEVFKAMTPLIYRKLKK
ncbi:MAG: hypothetical protein RIG62_09905 [Cyclobacteriaceae bacterium]